MCANGYCGNVCAPNTRIERLLQAHVIAGFGVESTFWFGWKFHSIFRSSIRI